MPCVLQALIIISMAAHLPPISGEGKWSSKKKDNKLRPLCDEDSREFMPFAILRDDGSMWDPETSSLYPKGTHWSEKEKNTNSTITFGCPCLLGRPCLRKCCQIGMALDSSSRCVQWNNETEDDGGAWFRPVMSEVIGKDVISVNGTKFAFGLLTDKPCLTKGKELNHTESYIKVTDANLCVINKEQEECFNFTRFCTDYNIDIGDYQSILCPVKKVKGWGAKFRHSDEENFAVNVFKFLTQTLSSIALLFIIILYILVSELRSMHGKCHMCHAFSLFVYYTLQNILLCWKHLRLMRDICFFLGPAEIYFYLAPLSWLNVMSLDILLAFVCLQPITHAGRYGDLKKFILYSVYAWGIPTLILIITIINDFTKEPDQQPNIDDWCEIGTFRKWAYRKYSMYTLLTANGIIFAMTAYKIFALRRATSRSMAHDSQRHGKDVDSTSVRTKMYLRLLILMGFHWILEPITKALHNILRLDERWYLRLIWYVIAIINRLQGVFILIMFLRNGKLAGSVWKKLFNSKLWTNFTSKIIEVSSHSRPTSSGLELDEASPAPETIPASKRDSIITYVESDDLSTNPSDIVQTPPITSGGEIPTLSNLVKSRKRKNGVVFSHNDFNIITSVPGENSSGQTQHSLELSHPKEVDVSNELTVETCVNTNDTNISTRINDISTCDEPKEIGDDRLEQEKDAEIVPKDAMQTRQKTASNIHEAVVSEREPSTEDTEFLFNN